jgi:hypothetical protein
MTQAAEAPARTPAQVSGRALRAGPWRKASRVTASDHIAGGRLENFSGHPPRYRARARVSRLNARRMQPARVTLGTLMLTGLYSVLVAGGSFSDPRIFN